jgi:hypothetical protein
MPPEDDNADVQDNLDLSINTEEQLLLKNLCMRNSNLQKQRDALVDKQQCIEAHARYAFSFGKKKSTSKPWSKKLCSYRPSKTRHTLGMAV